MNDMWFPTKPAEYVLAIERTYFFAGSILSIAPAVSSVST
jgi:hypothetical protein